MNQALSALALSLATLPVLAGGIERTSQTLGVLFEEDNYLEFTAVYVDLSISGRAVPTLGSFQSGEMSAAYWNYRAAFKTDLSPELSIALIYDQPFGADVDYPAGTGYFAQATVAELDTDALTVVSRYRVNDNWSAYAGLRH